MQIENNSQPMIVGYYPFRAKGQVVRLLCEYLHLNYTDRFFDPDEWSKFKDNEGKDWVVSDLPFLKDADFVVTGPIAIATYLTLKAGRDDLFGRTAEDKLKVDSIHNRCDIGTAMIAAKTIARPACEIPNKQCQEYYWKSKIKPLLNIYEKQCQASPWFIGYLTIIDFSVYEIVNHLERIYPQEIGQFVKLKEIKDRMTKLPEIEQYEKSERAVREYCPIRFFMRFREEKLRSTQASSSAISTISQSSQCPMDLE